MEIKGITIHNSNNKLSANENYSILKKSKRLDACHYLIDESVVIETIDENQSAFHTGRGYDFGNRYTLAIEICRSQCDEELYLRAEKRAIRLIKKLLKKYNLSVEDIYFHSDFNKVKCPHRTLEIYQTKERFINECFI